MGYDYRCTALNIRCPKCGEWHSPYNKCPHCGYTTKLNESIKHSIEHDLYTHQDYERSHPDRLICGICGSVYNRYKYEKEGILRKCLPKILFEGNPILVTCLEFIDLRIIMVLKYIDKLKRFKYISWY